MKRYLVKAEFGTMKLRAVNLPLALRAYAKTCGSRIYGKVQSVKLER